MMPSAAPISSSSSGSNNSAPGRSTSSAEPPLAAATLDAAALSGFAGGSVRAQQHSTVSSAQILLPHATPAALSTWAQLQLQAVNYLPSGSTALMPSHNTNSSHAASPYALGAPRSEAAVAVAAAAAAAAAAQQRRLHAAAAATRADQLFARPVDPRHPRTYHALCTTPTSITLRPLPMPAAAAAQPAPADAVAPAVAAVAAAAPTTSVNDPVTSSTTTDTGALYLSPAGTSGSRPAATQGTHAAAAAQVAAAAVTQAPVTLILEAHVWRDCDWRTLESQAAHRPCTWERGVGVVDRGDPALGGLRASLRLSHDTSHSSSAPSHSSNDTSHSSTHPRLATLTVTHVFVINNHDCRVWGSRVARVNGELVSTREGPGYELCSSCDVVARLKCDITGEVYLLRAPDIGVAAEVVFSRPDLARVCARLLVVVLGVALLLQPLAALGALLAAACLGARRAAGGLAAGAACAASALRGNSGSGTVQAGGPTVTPASLLKAVTHHLTGMTLVLSAPWGDDSAQHAHASQGGGHAHAHVHASHHQPAVAPSGFGVVAGTQQAHVEGRLRGWGAWGGGLVLLAACVLGVQGVAGSIMESGDLGEAERERDGKQAGWVWEEDDIGGYMAGAPGY